MLSNLLLTRELNIKIGDFGVSYVEDTNPTDISLQTNVGTDSYKSPEMRENRRYSYKTDVWYYKNYKMFLCCFIFDFILKVDWVCIV